MDIGHAWRSLTFFAAVSLAACAPAQTPSTPSPALPTAISVDGPDASFPGQDVSYRVKADSGLYLAVFVIPPWGGISTARIDSAPIGGSDRKKVQVTVKGLRIGEYYLVAVANGSEERRSALMKTVGDYMKRRQFRDADRSLDDLLTKMLPAVGEGFSVASASVWVTPTTVTRPGIRYCSPLSEGYSPAAVASRARNPACIP